MLRRSAFVLLFVVLMPATVQAFDHHHHHSSGRSKGGDGCGSSSSSSSSSSGSSSTPTPSTHKVVFVTATTYSGAIGSLAAADARCQASASAAGLGGVFRAWLSDDTHDAYGRLTDAAPWYTSNDELAFPAKAALLGAPQAELVDEDGNVPTSSKGAWSGTNARGTSTGENCEGWTNASPELVATIGASAVRDPAWGGGSLTLACSEKAALVCFQQ